MMMMIDFTWLVGEVLGKRHILKFIDVVYAVL